MARISAQVSVYPMRQQKLSPAINKALHTFHEWGLEVQPGSMSTLISGEDNAVFESLRQSFRQAGTFGDVVMQVTLSNACPMLDEVDRSIR